MRNMQPEFSWDDMECLLGGGVMCKLPQQNVPAQSVEELKEKIAARSCAIAV